jgi:hypothetical protein
MEMWGVSCHVRCGLAIARGLIFTTATNGISAVIVHHSDKLWVRIASSVLSESSLFLFNKPLAESTLEAMRTHEGKLYESANAPRFPEGVRREHHRVAFPR